ncbi:MAG: VRR-NUC domain-containing protein [Candidatus Omnitrophica bacterium]|nr:VRR-NUC domain-containing protein [Candidatus Omnitrophota bacterium]
MVNSHYNIRSQTLIKANKIPGVKLWPNPVGLGYAGSVAHEYNEGGNHFVVLKNPRRVRYGFAPGSSDCIGFRRESHNGAVMPRFVAIEIKAGKDVLRPAQGNFLKMVKNHGGIAEIVRNPDEVMDILQR